MTKTKYECGNCGNKHATGYINAMIKAGFNLMTIACPICGHYTLTEA